MNALNRAPRVAVAMLATALLAGCADKLDHFGRAPTFSTLNEPRHPIDPNLPHGPMPNAYGTAGPGAPGRYPGVGVGGRTAPAPAGHNSLWGGRYSTASTPTPRAQRAAYAPKQTTGRSSLWSNAPGSLFHDRRARDVGDILTVLIDIKDSASLNNSTDRSRSGEDSVSAATVFGLEELANRIIPGDTVSTDKGVSASGEATSSGSGTVTRDESISLRIAARVVQVLPNGHLVVTGNQEVRVNFELRDLQVAGIIRPEDITRQNTISYDRMANARIAYGGRGQIMDFQQPRLGQQLVDLISPF